MTFSRFIREFVTKVTEVVTIVTGMISGIQTINEAIAFSLQMEGPATTD